MFCRIEELFPPKSMILDFNWLASYICVVFFLHGILKLIYDLLILDIWKIKKIEWTIDFVILAMMFSVFIILGTILRHQDLDTSTIKFSIAISLISVPIIFSYIKNWLYRKYGIKWNGYTEMLLNVGYWLFLIILSILVTSHL